MPLTLSLTLVVTFSFLVSRLLQRFSARWLTTSTAYLAVGVLFGPSGVGVLDGAALTLLEPFISLTLGVVGFLLGLPLARQLGSAALVEAGLLSAVLATSAVGSLCFFLFPHIPGSSIEGGFLPALTLGAAATATSMPTLRMAVRRMGARGPVTRLVQSMSLIGNVLAVMVSGFALAVSVADSSALRLGLDTPSWIFASAALGIACGGLFHFFVLAEASDERIFLATVGIIVFASGMASGMGISALVLNAVAGVTVALASGRGRKRPVRSLEPLERPAFILLMIFAGGMLRLPPVEEFAPVGVVILIYTLLRGAVLFLSGGIAVRVIRRVDTYRRVGYGLLPLGGVAVAIALNYRLLNLPGGDIVLSSVVGATVLTELFSFNFLSILLVDAGEVQDLRRAARRIG